MLNRYLVLIIFVVFITGRIYAQAPSVSICNYLNNKGGAVSITLDDGCEDQFLIGQPIMDNLGFKATFFIITHYTPVTGFDYGCSSSLNWSNLQNAINQGHEIGGHTIYHSLLDSLYIKFGPDTVESEIKKSKDSLNKNLTGQKVLTFAYPEGDGGDDSPVSDQVRALLHKYYIGARTAGVGPLGYDTYPYALGTGFNDFYYQVESLPIENTTLNNYIQKLNGAIQDSGWFIPMYHNFNESSSSLSVTTAAFTDQMNAINARKDSLWIAPFRDVLKYHKEKTSASVNITDSPGLIVVGLTDTISSQEFDMPLTLLISNLATTYHIDSIKQGAGKLLFKITGNTVQFNALPNKGNITLYKSTFVSSIASLTTTAVSSITSSGASSGGNITSDGNAVVTARGICWSTSANPTITDSKTSNGSGTGSFTSVIGSLTASTSYYVRAYATNSAGTAYGNVVSFNTASPNTPVLTTVVISSVTSSSASSGGNMANNGGASVTARGVCWSTLPHPAISGSKTTDGSSVGIFTSSITNLNANTTYYVRAYATNIAGTGYGNELSFTTPAIAPSATTPVLSTGVSSSITSSGALSGGNVANDGGASVTTRGICWSTLSLPTISDNKTIDGTGIGSFTSLIINLNANTTYYVRAYATNSTGTGYGNELTFTTPAVTPSATIPVLSTNVSTSITSSGASSGGNIANNGGASVTTRGICWSTSTPPTISDSKTTDGSGVGSFTSSITNLNVNTTYYVRAYATNSIGTGYGNEMSFITPVIIPLSTVPLLSTSVSSSITSSSASSGGNITNDGGAPVTTRGACWSTSPVPTISDNKTNNGTDIGIFTSSINNLNPNTTYYVRAYATNSAGTAYGNELSFTTQNIALSSTIPILSTNATSSITPSGATSGGNITNDGNAAITTKGVCWGTSSLPTISASKTIDGTGARIFTSAITNLDPNTSYYVRAYATNSAGTAYGNEMSFTTPAIATCVTLSVALVITNAATSITSSRASSGGNVTCDGGSAVIAKGVCWSTSTLPTISDNKTINGSRGGIFTSSIRNLSPNTTYYIRAYATNSVGTGYGNVLSFSTTSSCSIPTPPKVISNIPSSITSSNASSGGNVTCDGNAVVTSRGVCWGTSSLPTISNSKTINGMGMGSFTSSITNLNPNTTYYIRAYATNSVGTGYGSEVSFTTLLSTGITNNSSLDYNIKMYPNPSTGIFHLSIESYDSPLLELQIINAGGTVVYKEDLNHFTGNYSKDIDINGLLRGFYCLEVITEKTRIIRKMIVQ